MDQWKSVDEILDFAIKNEEGAAKFYRDLAGKMKHKSMREVFLGFSEEEEGHKTKLLEVKHTGGLEPSSKKVMDLKIGDYLVDEGPREDMDYQAALILAMKQEKAAFKMYSDLAGKTDDPDLRSMLLGLAQEEAKHKLRFEIEYDDEVLKWD